MQFDGLTVSSALIICSLHSSCLRTLPLHFCVCSSACVRNYSCCLLFLSIFIHFISLPFSSSVFFLLHMSCSNPAILGLMTRWLILVLEGRGWVGSLGCLIEPRLIPHLFIPSGYTCPGCSIPCSTHILLLSLLLLMSPVLSFGMCIDSC